MIWVAGLLALLTAWAWADSASLIPTYIVQVAPQCAAVALVLAVISLVFKRRKAALLLAFVALAQLAMMLQAIPLTHPSPSSAHEEALPRLRVMSFNVHRDNMDAALIAARIHEIQPDIIWMPEMRRNVYLALRREIQQEYLHFFPASLHDMPNQSSVIFSKYPLEVTKTEEIIGQDEDDKLLALKIIHANADVQGTRLDVIGLHLISPKNSTRLALHDTQLSMVSAYVLGKAALPKDAPLVVMGDMNSAVWRPQFATFMKLIGVHPTASLLSLPLSWPNWLPPLLRIPIDTVLVSPTLCHNGLRGAKEAGSDHLPVYVDVWGCD